MALALIRCGSLQRYLVKFSPIALAELRISVSTVSKRCNTDSSVSEPSHGKKSNIPYMRHGQTSKQDYDRFRDMLACLKCRQAYSLGSFIIHAPDLAVQWGNWKIFADVADEWLRQSKPTFDGLSSDHFNPALILARLGYINRQTSGLVFEKFNGDWRSVEYFLRRMCDAKVAGFQRFEAEDIVAALAAIRHFAMFSSGPVDGKSSAMQQWLNEFANYITGKEPKDSGYGFLQRRASFILFVLSDVWQTGELPFGLLPYLCQLAKRSFDQHQRDELFDCRPQSQSVVNVNEEVSCFYYSLAFLHWNLDANSIVSDSWKSWYRICALVLETFLKQCRYGDDSVPRLTSAVHLASVAASVTKEFDVYDEFSPIFPFWKRIMEEVLLRCSGKRPDEEMDSDKMALLRTNLSNFIYNFGFICQHFDQKSGPRRSALIKFVPMLVEAVANVGLSDGLAQCRTLTGLRNMKVALQMNDLILSDKYLRMLRDWSVRTRRRSTRQIPKLANQASNLLFLLRELKLHTSGQQVNEVVEELARLFEHTFDGLQESELNRALSYFGDACVNFNFDPSKINSFGSNGDIWLRYFEKANHCLENALRILPHDSVSHEEKKKLCHLLSVIADITYRYETIEEFKALYPVYEKILKGIFATLKARQCHFLARTLKVLSEKEGLEVEQQLLVAMIRKARGWRF